MDRFAGMGRSIAARVSFVAGTGVAAVAVWAAIMFFFI